MNVSSHMNYQKYSFFGDFPVDCQSLKETRNSSKIRPLDFEKKP